MITGIIPQTGRQCYAALNKFSQLTNNDFTHAINILNQSKSISTSSLNEAHKKLSRISENQNIFISGITQKDDQLIEWEISKIK